MNRGSLVSASWLSLSLVLSLTLLSGCAARKSLSAELPHVAYAEEESSRAQASPPPVLTQNHFIQDRTGSLSEAALRQILEAPVFLESRARVGVVPVRTAYAPEHELPLAGVPAVLTDALDRSGHFELVCEVSTDFPADRGISGLRELAARYRADYLLLYRHRFVEDRWANAGAVTWATGIGALVVKGRTLAAAGVLEATLFDVKTGTLLFTVHERIEGEERVVAGGTQRKAAGLRRRLLEGASERLADGVMARVQRLVAARPEAQGEALVSSASISAPALPLPVEVQP